MRMTCDNSLGRALHARVVWQWVLSQRDKGTRTHIPGSEIRRARTLTNRVHCLHTVFLWNSAATCSSTAELTTTDIQVCVLGVSLHYSTCITTCNSLDMLCWILPSVETIRTNIYYHLHSGLRRIFYCIHFYKTIHNSYSIYTTKVKCCACVKNNNTMLEKQL